MLFFISLIFLYSKVSFLLWPFLSPLPYLLFNIPSPLLETWAAGPATLPTAAQTPAWGGGASASGRAAGRGPSGERVPQGRQPAPASPRQIVGGQVGGQAQETQLSAGKQQRDEAETDHPSPGEVLLWHLTLTGSVPDRRWGQAAGIFEVPEVARDEKRARGGSRNTRLNSHLVSSP